MSHARETVLYEPEAVRRVIDRTEDPEAEAILRLAWEAALSAQEIASLKWEDVDLPAGVLRVSGREVPVPADLAAFLKEKPRRSLYVVASVRGGGETPMDRVSVSWKVRPLLTAGGLPGASLKTLRENSAVRMMQTEPVGHVSRRTGYDPLWLASLYRKYTGRAVPSHARPRDAVFTDEALCRALDDEGDTMVSRAVYLSWQGDLSLREAIGLRWRDIDLPAGRWTVAGGERPIPPVLRDRLSRWREGEAADQPLLRGARSRKSPDMNFLSKRVTAFLQTHRLDGLTLLQLRGKGARPEEEDLIFQEVAKRGRTGVNTICAALGISRSRVRWHLDRMVAAGRLRLIRGMGYMAPDQSVPWTQVTKIIHDAGASGGVVTMRACAETARISPSLAEYYLRKAMKMGLIERVGTGVYRCLPES